MRRAKAASEPEIASVGRTQEELEQAGVPLRTGVFPFLANGRARALAGSPRQSWFALAMSDFGTSGTINKELPLLALAYRLTGEEVFKTRDRTGILIFLALFEHRAVILADEGIHRAVPREEWQALVDELVAGIRAGRGVAALCGPFLALFTVRALAWWGPMSR